jgi:hypothetical protein
METTPATITQPVAQETGKVPPDGDRRATNGPMLPHSGEDSSASRETLKRGRLFHCGEHIDDDVAIVHFQSMLGADCNGR